jgi:GcrA cell cycle regulator
MIAILSESRKTIHVTIIVNQALTFASEYQKYNPGGVRMEARTGSVEVEQVSWPPEHSQALREYHAKGMSYSQIARALNARFATEYSRSAVLGRAKRMGLADTDQRRAQQPMLERMLRERAAQARSSGTKLSDTRPASQILSEFRPRKPAFAKVSPVELRCVDVSPRHLSLIELERKDCRYPYGGDEEGEAITFCGHPRRKGSSYCTPHFHLTRNAIIPTERAVREAPLRLVDVDRTLEKLMETNLHGTNQTQETV